ncbi:MAG: PEP-CTERM sorting domain-containing protein [Desulfobacteraceae bacterium]|nr:PEP-CTERM sorting domain-containing protein [Desulfobacteraceae bacterium]
MRSFFIPDFINSSHSFFNPSQLRVDGTEYLLADLTVRIEVGQPVPEPATVLLFGLGLLGLAGVNRRKI